MVFWVLLSLFLATSDDRRILTPLFSGMALGMGVLTKENAIFFMPVIGYLLYVQVRLQFNYRFALTFWFFGVFSIISVYFLYAALKNELLPSHLSFNLNQPPADHVALLYTIWQQLHRSQGGIRDLHSLFWTFSLGTWLPTDTVVLVGGLGATLMNFLIWLLDRNCPPAALVASILYFCYGFILL